MNNNNSNSNNSNKEGKKRKDSKILVLQQGAQNNLFLVSSHTSFSAACRTADKLGDGRYLIVTVRQIRNVLTETLGPPFQTAQ